MIHVKCEEIRKNSYAISIWKWVRKGWHEFLANIYVKVEVSSILHCHFWHDFMDLQKINFLDYVA